MTGSSGSARAARRLSLVYLACMAVGLQAAWSETPGSAYYTVQVMVISERNRANAFALRDRLREKGFEAYVLSPRGADGRVTHKIRIGRFPRRGEALRLAERLKQTEGLKPLVLKSWLSLVEEKAPARPEAARDKRIPAASPSPKESPPGILALAAEPPPGPKPAEKPPSEPPSMVRAPWPRSTTRIYVYRDSRGALHVTNRMDTIPPKERAKIEKITVYPALYLSPGSRPGRLLLQMAGKTEEVVLDGVEPLETASEADFQAFFEAHLAGRPLRVEYDPRRSTAKGVIYGGVTYRDGRRVNEEVVRAGLGKMGTPD